MVFVIKFYENCIFLNYVKFKLTGSVSLSFIFYQFSAPKVPFLNSALPEECPGSLYWRYRIDGSVLSALDEACARAEPTPESVQRCASPSLASLGRWI